MIARMWYGATRVADADAYVPYVYETGVKEQRATPGNLGSLVFRRVGRDRAEFVVLSLWDSMAAVTAFAGDQPETAVYYPEDDRFLLERTPTVDHYEIVSGSAVSLTADAGRTPA